MQRNNISRLSDLLPKEEKKKYKKFKTYAPRFLHIDTSEIRINKQKWYLFAAIDRATRFVYIAVYDNKRMQTAANSFTVTAIKNPLVSKKTVFIIPKVEFNCNLEV